MLTIVTHQFEAGRYVAALDPLAGNGLLAMPDDGDDDVLDPFHTDGRTLLDAEFQATMLALLDLGVEASESDDGLDDVVHEEPLPDGRRVIGLFMRDPIHPDADVDDALAGLAECRQRLELHPAGS